MPYWTGRAGRIRVLIMGGLVAIIAARCAAEPSRRAPTPSSLHSTSRTTVRDDATTTSTTSEPATTSTTTLPAPAAGFVPGHVTAVGDSVMLDYQTPLEMDIRGWTSRLR